MTIIIKYFFSNKNYHNVIPNILEVNKQENA